MALLAAIGVLEAQDAAAEADRIDHVGPLEFPGVAVAQPVFRLFDLLAVLDALVEQAELVADAVAVAGITVGGQGIEETGGQAAEAAVAEGGVRLAVDDLVQVNSGSGQGLRRDIVDPQVKQALLELPADQVFHRQVIDPLGIGLVLAARCRHQPLAENSPQQVGQRVVPVTLGRIIGITPNHVHKVVAETALHDRRICHDAGSRVVAWKNGHGRFTHVKCYRRSCRLPPGGFNSRANFRRYAAPLGWTRQSLEKAANCSPYSPHQTIGFRTRDTKFCSAKIFAVPPIRTGRTGKSTRNGRRPAGRRTPRSA